jgi:hypothetical protein
VFTRRCNEHAACFCAVAVRSGPDVLRFDTCGPTGNTPLGIQISPFITEPLTAGTSLVRLDDGKAYKVIIIDVP